MAFGNQRDKKKRLLGVHEVHHETAVCNNADTRIGHACFKLRVRDSCIARAGLFISSRCQGNLSPRRHLQVTAPPQSTLQIAAQASRFKLRKYCTCICFQRHHRLVAKLGVIANEKPILYDNTLLPLLNIPV
eukprot:1147457-Pelagomonas_calceolata.AAC.1